MAKYSLQPGHNHDEIYEKIGEGGGGVTDHGLLDGLADDDHSQYLNNTRHDTTTRHALGTVVPHDDHGALSGLADNDHPQYLLTTAKAADSDKLDGVDSTGFVQTSNNQTVGGIKTFTSIPVLPATNPTTDNQAARKGYVDSVAISLLDVYPIGSIYMSVNATNPGTLFGGTWSVWGTGRVPVGIDTSDTAFDTVEETGGAKTHTHGLDAGHAKLVPSTDGWVAMRRKAVPSWVITHKNNASYNSAIGASTSYGAELGGSTDSDGALPPYIVCYMWKRIA